MREYTMYGMINAALNDFIRTRHGEQAWNQVLSHAAIEEEVFISNRDYPDQVTFELVGAAEAVLGISQRDILEEFGKHWILVTGQQGYGDLLRAGGRTLREFLINLPNFHNRISLIFSDSRPPQFCHSGSNERSLTLHYQSERKGLTFCKRSNSGTR